MLADFTITVHDDNRPYDIQVKVYKSVRAMRSAKTQSERPKPTKREKARRAKTGEGLFLGLCERFTLFRTGEDSPDPLCAIVRLAQPHLGVGIISHELAHAAVWIRELKHGEVPLVTTNDEEFCWILGELVRQTIDTLYAKGVYD